MIEYSTFHYSIRRMHSASLLKVEGERTLFGRLTHHKAVNCITNICQAVTQSVFGASWQRLQRWKGLLLLLNIDTSDVCVSYPLFVVKCDLL